MSDERNHEIELSPMLEKLAEQYAADPKSKKFLPLAEEYRKSKMYEEAIYFLTEGLKIHPDYIPARLTLAKCYLETRERESALHVLNLVIDENPDNVPALRLIAELHKELGNFSRASEHLDHLISLNPQDQVAQGLLQEIRPHLDEDIPILAAPPNDDKDNRRIDGTWQHHDTGIKLELDREHENADTDEELDLSDEGDADIAFSVPEEDKDGDTEIRPRVIELSTFDEEPSLVVHPSRQQEMTPKPAVEPVFSLDSEAEAPSLTLDTDVDDDLKKEIPVLELNEKDIETVDDLEDEGIIEVDIDQPLFEVEDEETGDDSFEMFHKLSSADNGPLSLEPPTGSAISDDPWADLEEEEEETSLNAADADEPLNIEPAPVSSNVGLETVRDGVAMTFETPDDETLQNSAADILMSAGEASGGASAESEEALSVTPLPDADQLVESAEGDLQLSPMDIVETGPEVEISLESSAEDSGEEDELVLTTDDIVPAEAEPAATMGESFADSGSDGDTENDLLLSPEDQYQEEVPAPAPAFETVELHLVDGSDLLMIEDEELDLDDSLIVERGVAPYVEEESVFSTTAAPEESGISAETPERGEDRDFLLGGPEDVAAASLSEELTAEPGGVDSTSVFDLGVPAEAVSAGLMGADAIAADFDSQSLPEEAEADETPAEDAMPITATSARIYEEQGLYHEALDIYRKLAARFPMQHEYLEKIASLEGRLIMEAGASEEYDEDAAVLILRRWLHNIDMFKSDAGKGGEA